MTEHADPANVLDETQHHLEVCIASLARSRRELLALLDEAETKARAAVATTDPDERLRLLNEACDAEFSVLTDCDACGGLMQALGLDKDS